MHHERADGSQRERLVGDAKVPPARAAEALAATSATVPAARLVIQKNCVLIGAASIAHYDWRVVTLVAVLVAELPLLVSLPLADDDPDDPLDADESLDPDEPLDPDAALDPDDPLVLPVSTFALAPRAAVVVTRKALAPATPR